MKLSDKIMDLAAQIDALEARLAQAEKTAALAATGNMSVLLTIPGGVSITVYDHGLTDKQRDEQRAALAAAGWVVDAPWWAGGLHPEQVHGAIGNMSVLLWDSRLERTPELLRGRPEEER